MQVMLRVIEYMREKGIRPGGRFPPMLDMAKEIGISTGTLREQIYALAMFGVVSVRPKMGICVQPMSMQQLLSYWLLYAGVVDSSYLRHYFFDLYKVLEQSSWRVSLPPNESILAALDATNARIAEMLSSPQIDSASLHGALQEWSLALCESSGPCVRDVLTAFWKAQPLTTADKANAAMLVQQLVDAQHAFTQALRNHDTQQAETAMEARYARIADLIAPPGEYAPPTQLFKPSKGKQPSPPSHTCLAHEQADVPVH